MVSASSTVLARLAVWALSRRAQALIAGSDVPPLPDEVRRRVRTTIDTYLSGCD